MSVSNSQSSETSFEITEFFQTLDLTREALAKGLQGDVKKTRTRKRASILTNDQKKKHHIESEHKRRKAIRDAFAKLVEVVPELTPSDSRSEIVVLNKSSEYLKQLFDNYECLVFQVKQRGISINDELLAEIPKRNTADYERRHLQF